ncbi:hypothetical protein CsSME_00039953 [Camellia sinensis var. sinensis]
MVSKRQQRVPPTASNRRRSELDVDHERGRGRGRDPVPVEYDIPSANHSQSRSRSRRRVEGDMPNIAMEDAPLPDSPTVQEKDLTQACSGGPLIHHYCGVSIVMSLQLFGRGRCGCLDESVKAFLEREEADVVLWSSMIAAYGFHGKGEEAIELFNQMDQVGLDANDVTFLSLLYACKHYTCVVDLLGRSGCLEETEGFIRTMPVKKDAIIWKTLLSACKILKNADIAKRIAEEVLRLEPQDSAPYMLLSNIQASAKRWQDVSEVRKVMRDRRVKKKPGISWFEVKNQVHQFCMGDKSHPQSMEIDMYLKELTWEMKLRGCVPDTGSILHDMDAEEKEHNLAHHSKKKKLTISNKKLAIAFALMNTPEGVPIRVMKNLHVCGDCHVAIKYISEIQNREIIVRDASGFHHFKDGKCSCADYW